MKPASLSQKFFFWILLMATVPVVILTTVYLVSFKNMLLQKETENISQMADASIREIERYIDEAIIDNRLLSNSLSTLNALKVLIPLYENRDDDNGLFFETERSLHKYFQSFHVRGYHDIFLFSPEGNNILTLAHEKDFATNIFTGPYRDSGLSRVVQRAKFLMETSTSSFEYYAPSDEMAAFFATPVLSASRRLLGIVAIQINSDIIQGIARNAGGLLNSREVLIGAKKDNSFSFQTAVKHDSTVKVGVPIPLHDDSAPLVMAMRGISGITIAKDYRGVETLAATRYIPSLNWGLVLKEDMDEVMQVFDQMVHFGVLILIAILFAVILLARFMGRSVAKPLESMIKVIRSIADGGKEIKVIPEGFRENFELAESFNLMSDHLRSATTVLEQRVDERTYELKTSKQNLEVTLNSIGDGVIVTDEKGRITRMNPVAETLTGWSLVDAFGQSLTTVFAVINTATRQPIPNPVEKVIKTGGTIHLGNQTTLISKDGREYQISDSAAPIRNENGSILGLVLVFNDATEQYHLREQAKSVQQRLQGLFDDMQTMICILEPDGTAVFVNNTPLRLADIEESDVIGKKLWDSPWLKYDTKLQDLIQRDIVNVGKGKTVLRDIQVAMADGLMWIEFSAHPVVGEDGQVIQILAEGRDVSKRLQQEEQLRRSLKMDALGKLTGGIAHDYNNMLGIILGFTELLQVKLKDQPKLSKYTDAIHHAGERGAELTKKLLSFSRQKTSEAEMLCLNEMLQSLQHLLERTLTVRIKLVFDLTENLWPVWLNSGELEDALINIGINAMHAIEGNGRLTIQTRNKQINETDAQVLNLEPNDYVLLRITDTGCGIDDTDKDSIFDPFYTTKGEMGTGLGLSQVYGFVERSKGAIKVYSELNHGSQFVLYFPRYHQNDGDEKPNEESSPTVVENIKGTETILLVDDEPSLLEVNSEILRQYGYNALCAESADNALSILEHETVDLLLSDIIMPGMDGYQLASIVQKKYPDIIIQLLSGFSDNPHVDLVDETLSQNILSKPLDSKKLLRRIRKLFEEKSRNG